MGTPEHLVAAELAVLGANVRRLRDARGLTQGQLGAAAGISPNYLGALERGERNPTFKLLLALAGALGVEVPDLVENISPNR